MNKAEFLRELDHRLAKVAGDERSDIINDYEEHIRTAMEHGMSEGDAVASLGSPKTIAKELLADHYIHQAEEQGTVRNVFRASLATVSLGFFNLVFVVGPFAGLVGVLVAMFGVAIGFVIGPLLGCGGMLLGLYPTGIDAWWMALFAYAAMEGLGILLLVAFYKIGVWFAKLCLRYLRFNLKMIQGAK